MKTAIPFDANGCFFLRQKQLKDKVELQDEDDSLLAVQTMTFTPDGRNLILLLPHDSILSLNITTGQIDFRIKAKGLDSETIAVSPDNSSILLTGVAVPLRKWSMTDHTEDQTYAPSFYEKGGSHDLSHVFISPDNRVVITARLELVSNSRKLHFSEFSTGNKICEWKNEEEIICATTSPDNKYIVFGSNAYNYDNIQFQLFILKFNTEPCSLENIELIQGDDSIVALAISPDGKYIISASDDGAINKYDLHSCELKDTLFIDLKLIYSLVISPDGQYFFVGGDNNCEEPVIRMYEMATGEEIQYFSHPELDTVYEYHDNGDLNENIEYDHSWIKQICISPDGQFLVGVTDSDSSEQTQKIAIWSLKKNLGGNYIDQMGPLILTPAWYPPESLDYMRKTEQGIISDSEPLVRCGECGKMLPVGKKQMGKVITCPHPNCGRKLKINDFSAETRNKETS